MSEPGRTTVHCTELPDLVPGGVFQEEWDTYRREVGRLLAEGHEGRFVLIKGRHVLDVYDTWDSARVAGLRMDLTESFFVKQVLVREPVLRVRGYGLPCHG
jgi:hypothetical protein